MKLWSWILGCLMTLPACADEPGTTGTGGGGTGAGGTGAEGGGGSGGSGGNDWSCLGKLGAKTFSPGTAEGHLRVVELQEDAPMPDVLVKVCDASDASCASPLASGTSDAMGLLTLDVTTAVQRYLELTGPNMLDVLSFNNGPPASDPFDELVRVISPGTFTIVEALLEVSGDPTRGHAGLQANDCRGDIGVGVSFTIDSADADTVFGYFDPNGAPMLGFDRTTSDGRAAVANIPAGPAVLTATIAATGQVIGTRTFFVRPEAISYPACVEADPEAQ
ncbi:MAG: hypothetical protein R3B72_34860 [Polyangiaceae bacterium]